MYSSRVQQPWCMQGDAGGRIGTSDLLKQLVRLRLPVTTDQKVGGSSPSERARSKVPTTRERPPTYPVMTWAVPDGHPGTRGDAD